MRFTKRLQRVCASLDRPTARLIVAGVLFISGIFELADTAIEEALGRQIGTGHGVLVFAVSEAGRALHTFFENAENALKVASAVNASDD